MDAVCLDAGSGGPPFSLGVSVSATCFLHSINHSYLSSSFQPALLPILKVPLQSALEAKRLAPAQTAELGCPDIPFKRREFPGDCYLVRAQLSPILSVRSELPKAPQFVRGETLKCLLFRIDQFQLGQLSLVVFHCRGSQCHVGQDPRRTNAVCRGRPIVEHFSPQY